MTDELTLEGKQYISSKRAAVLSGYAQDYVGQLCRKGLIDAQRIGGLWYVFMDSLLKYKEKAEAYVPQPPQTLYKNESPDTLIAFDGKDYVSAARASELTGYHQDYVGQLARGGKILSRQVGNRWYVEREGILSHKQEKDALLAAVQSQAVGIAKEVVVKTTPYEQKIEAWEPLNYETDTSALIPELSVSNHAPQEESPVEQETNIHIRVVENAQKEEIFPKRETKKVPAKRTKISGKTIFYALFSIIILASFSGYVYSPYSIFRNENAGKSAQSGVRAKEIASRSVLATMGDVIEPYITKELVYNRD